MLSEVTFAKGMTFLSIALGEKNLEDATLEVYYTILKNMSDESFMRSVESVAATRKYKGLPTPAEILKFDTTRDDIFSGTEKQAKAMYDKFYAECCAMLDYCTANRNQIASDRDFFKSCNYEKLKRVDGTQAYNKQELYVLNALGGGEFLLNIRFEQNISSAVAKIEREIKKAIEIKYFKQSSNAIENKRVFKMLHGVA
jgi:hypothetical protein